MSIGYMRLQEVSDIIISNLTIDGNRDQDYDFDFGSDDINSLLNLYDILMENCSNIWFDNVNVINSEGYVFAFGLQNKNNWGQNVTMSNCFATENRADGFAIDQIFDICIVNCSLYDNGRHGFDITGIEVVNLINNIANDNGYGLFGPGSGYIIRNNPHYNASIYMCDCFASMNMISSLSFDDTYNIVFTKDCLINTSLETNGSYIYLNNNIYDTEIDIIKTSTGANNQTGTTGTITNPVTPIISANNNLTNIDKTSTEANNQTGTTGTTGTIANPVTPITSASNNLKNIGTFFVLLNLFFI